MKSPKIPKRENNLKQIKPLWLPFSPHTHIQLSCGGRRFGSQHMPKYIWILTKCLAKPKCPLSLSSVHMLQICARVPSGRRRVADSGWRGEDSPRWVAYLRARRGRRPTERQTARRGGHVPGHGVKTTGRAIKPFKSNGRTNWFPSSRKLYEVLQPRVDTWWMDSDRGALRTATETAELGEMLNEIEVDWPRYGEGEIRNQAEIERLQNIYWLHGIREDRTTEMELEINRIFRGFS